MNLRTMHIVAVMLFGACTASDSTPEFVLSVSVYSPDPQYSVTAESGSVTMDSPSFYRVDVPYPSYEVALDDISAHVFVEYDTARVSEIVVEVAYCGELCQSHSCAELGAIVGQQRALSVDPDGIIYRTPLACFSCSGNTGVEVMACP